MSQLPFLVGFLALLTSVLADDDVLGSSRVFVKYHPTGFTGFRSAFQWTFGVEDFNEGFFNFIKFETDEAGGYAGLITDDNSENCQVHFSVKFAKRAEAASGFNCTEYSVREDEYGYKCYQDNFDFENNAVYFIDVEISGSVFKAYISYAYENLHFLNRTDMPRIHIGDIHWSDELHNLIPVAYYNHNYVGQSSCHRAYELVTVNYAPVQYNGYRRLNAWVDGIEHRNKKCPTEQIMVAITPDHQSTVYFSRARIHTGMPK
ncbi:uncharacterized protein LOC115631226 [Scaptodrosophila lebanonensis]|uniref:Uncharacterized protein LOC115631226 n=1 Tax=Drosophila lebanonensis TaxID=7225 RepID=A0A6J2U8C5_DROLE|nr:uncharacterized protein LOC115631226 [Scaptodrosophila lebanonensis]